MIRPGINENVLITKIEINDKGSVAVTMREAGAVTTTGEELDDFAALTEGGMATESAGFDTTIIVFPWKPTKTNGEALNDKQIGEDIKRTKNLFTHILGAFQAVQDVKFDRLYNETGIVDSDTYKRGIHQENILKQMFKNLAEQFIELMAPHIKAAKPVRILLLRRSKDVHYVTFRNKFLAENPMIELMDIPVGATKLAFTKYEKDNGLDNPDPVSPSQADAPAADGAAPDTSVPGMDDLPFPDNLDQMGPEAMGQMPQ